MNNNISPLNLNNSPRDLRCLKFSGKSQGILNSFNYFRGIAIIIIVMGHCWGGGNWITTSLPGKLFINLILGGTSFFVFISGFLFYYIFYRNFHYQTFIIKKIQNVLVPYVILSIIPISFYVFKHSGPYELFTPSQPGIFNEYYKPFMLLILTGSTLPAYWYIPFIMIIFALSPLFIKFINLPLRARMAIIFFFFALSMIIHRPINNLCVFQSVIYFTPIYMLGVMASMHRDQIYSAFKNGKEIYLLLAAFLLSFIQITFYPNFGNFHKRPFVLSVFDINIIQKSILCLFFMIWLHRFEDKKLHFLNKTAEASFAIFFIHPLILNLFSRIEDISNNQRYLTMMNIFKFFDSPLGLLVLTIIVLICCYITAASIKRIFGSFSRQIIGW